MKNRLRSSLFIFVILFVLVSPVSVTLTTIDKAGCSDVIPMAGFYINSAFANSYPIYPGGTYVTLSSGNFIQSVPDQSPGMPNPNPVIGDNLNQHPGGFGVGWPIENNFFIGVFGGPIDTKNPNAAVYLWETTGGGVGLNGAPGPLISVGFWDGTEFIMPPDAVTVPSHFYDTGQWLYPYYYPYDYFYMITSSITPLSAFNLGDTTDFGIYNAVKISYNPHGHNQVTAVATNIVPEPSTFLLLGVGLAGVGFLRRRMKK